MLTGNNTPHFRTAFLGQNSAYYLSIFTVYVIWYLHKLGGKQAHRVTRWPCVHGPAASASVWPRAEKSEISVPLCETLVRENFTFTFLTYCYYVAWWAESISWCNLKLCHRFVGCDRSASCTVDTRRLLSRCQLMTVSSVQALAVGLSLDQRIIVWR